MSRWFWQFDPSYLQNHIYSYEWKSNGFCHSFLSGSSVSFGMELPSREFSSSSLKCGLSLVKEEVGMDPLADMDNEALQTALQSLEDSGCQF